MAKDYDSVATRLVLIGQEGDHRDTRQSQLQAITATISDATHRAWVVFEGGLGGCCGFTVGWQQPSTE
jgi:hypothetical protein